MKVKTLKIATSDGNIAVRPKVIIHHGDFKFFVHRPCTKKATKEWYVSEYKTGRKVGKGKTQKAAIEDALHKIELHYATMVNIVHNSAPVNEG